MMKSFLLPLISALTLAGCIAPAADSDEKTAVASQALSADPALRGQYTACPSHFTSSEGVAAHAFYPAVAACGTAVESPVVVVLRAVGGYFDDQTLYDPLLQHLSSHGFIAVSFHILAVSNDDAGHAAVSATVRRIMHEDLLTSWPHGYAIDTTRLALIGHSRGGSTTRRIADDLSKTGVYTTRAVVSLAGSAIGVPAGLPTRSFLVLHGSDDGDVLPESSYKNYAQAGAGIPKAMKLIEGAGHRSLIGESTNASITRGYVVAFLAAHLHHHQKYYDKYIRGNQVPFDETRRVATLAQEATALTVDTFEDGTIGDNDLHGGVNLSDLYYQNIVDFRGSTSPLFTTVLSLVAVDESAHVTWRIPAADASTARYDTLSFSIGQGTGTATTGMTVQVRSGTTWSSEVLFSKEGPIERRMSMCTQTAGLEGCAQENDVSLMGTVRIALSAFGATSNITRVRLRFRGDSLYKTFYVDDVRLEETETRF